MFLQAFGFSALLVGIPFVASRVIPAAIQDAVFPINVFTRIALSASLLICGTAISLTFPLFFVFQAGLLPLLFLVSTYFLYLRRKT